MTQATVLAMPTPVPVAKPADNAPPLAGWHFLQVPGPTNIPQRILRAIDRPAIDYRSQPAGRLARECFDGLARVFKTDEEVFIFPASGTGAWEAAIVNTLSPGDKVLMFDSGQFSFLWVRMAKKFGLDVEVMANDWRRGPDPAAIEARLAEDRGHAIKAVMAVHNETSNGTTSRIAEIRRALDAAHHPALLFVDTISSLACMDYRHDDWGVDVSICGSQKGLMLPPGLSFNAVSEKARKASQSAKMPRCYWDWEWMREHNGAGFFPYTPAVNLLFGLKESLVMLDEEGLDNVFARHARLGEAVRVAVRAWGLRTVCADAREHSNSVTAVFVPEGHDADAMRALILKRYNMALGGGLARLAGRVFRIGHMGDCNDLMISGVLAGVEMGLSESGIPFVPGGAQAATRFLASA